MRERIAAIVFGAIALLLAVLNQASLLDFVLSKLRASGFAGVLVANILTSTATPVVLGLTAIALALDAWRLARAVSVQSMSRPPAAVTSQSSLPVREMLERLMSYRRSDHTSIESDRLIEPYIGRQIDGVTIVVKDILALNDSILMVHSVKGKNSDPVSLVFDAERWGARLATIGRGSVIRASGKIGAVYEHGVTLNDCELLDE